MHSVRKGWGEWWGYYHRSHSRWIGKYCRAFVWNVYIRFCYWPRIWEYGGWLQRLAARCHVANVVGQFTANLRRVNFPIKPELSPGICAICNHQLRVGSATERITELPR